MTIRPANLITHLSMAAVVVLLFISTSRQVYLIFSTCLLERALFLLPVVTFTELMIMLSSHHSLTPLKIE